MIILCVLRLFLRYLFPSHRPLCLVLWTGGRGIFKAYSDLSAYCVHEKARQALSCLHKPVYSEGLEKIPNPASTRNRALASGFTVQRGLANRPHSREPPRMLYLPIRDLVCFSAKLLRRRTLYFSRHPAPWLTRNKAKFVLNLYTPLSNTSEPRSSHQGEKI